MPFYKVKYTDGHKTDSYAMWAADEKEAEAAVKEQLKIEGLFTSKLKVLSVTRESYSQNII